MNGTTWNGNLSDEHLFIHFQPVTIEKLNSAYKNCIYY